MCKSSCVKAAPCEGFCVKASLCKNFCVKTSSLVILTVPLVPALELLWGQKKHQTVNFKCMTFDHVIFISHHHHQQQHQHHHHHHSHRYPHPSSYFLVSYLLIFSLLLSLGPHCRLVLKCIILFYIDFNKHGSASYPPVDELQTVLLKNRMTMGMFHCHII